MTEYFRPLSEVPLLWVVFIALVFSALLIYLVNKRVSIRLGALSLEAEKKAIEVSEDNSIRILIYSQIREYENYTGKIERLLFHSFEKTFPKMEQSERSLVRLLCNLVRRALEKQLMLDIIANHIIDKSPEELRDYTSNKVQSYSNRINNFLSNYNDIVLPDKDISLVMRFLDIQSLEEIYFDIYTRVVRVARG